MTFMLALQGQREGSGDRSGENLCHDTLCHDIFTMAAGPITTVSVAANTYCMMDGLSSLRT